MHPARPLSRRTLLALAAAPAWAAAQSGHDWQPWPRQLPMPVLDLPVWGGGRWQLAAQRGRPVLLNLWATWCEPCVEELPALAALGAAYASQGLGVVFINHREAPAAIERFQARGDPAAEALAHWPVLLDSDGAATRALGVNIFPSTVLVARDGRPVSTCRGDPGWAGAAAQARVAALLAPPRR